MGYILAHDLGTTGNKANLFDENGTLIASHLKVYPVAYPQPQWAEQNPEDWWQAVCAATRALLQSVPNAKSEIAGVSFSGQMMGVAAMDAEHRPLQQAIIWADQRAVEQARLITERCGLETIYARTGHRVSAAYTAAKILWLKAHQPELYLRAAKFLCAKDYAVLRLTDQFATDYSDASGSNLFDLKTRRWCEDLIDVLELDVNKFPRPCSSVTIVGEVTRRAAGETGLRPGTPVVIGGGDGACAAVGAGVVEPGECYGNIGASAWISFASDKVLLDPEMRTFTFHHLHPSRYAPMGTMQTAGGARDWLTRITGEVSEAEIAAVPLGAHGLLFLPYLMGERSPWWNAQARGAFVGLTMVHGRAEMARAVLEGVAFNLSLILNALASQSMLIPRVRLIGGGARSQVWCQILADALNRPIDVLDLTAEASCWGAAVAGGIGVGLYPDWRVATAHTHIARSFEPRPENVARYAELVERFTETYRALEPVA